MNCKLRRLVRRFCPMALYLCAVGGWIALCCHDASYGMFWPALAVASFPAALFSAPNAKSHTSAIADSVHSLVGQGGQDAC